MKDTMTPKERWLAVLRRETPDRIPMDYWATDETTRMLLKHLDCTREAMYDRLHIDRVATVRPRYAGPPVADDADEFGCRYRPVDYGAGVYRECVHHPLAGYESIDEIEAEYTWPSIDWWDFTAVAEGVAGCEHLPVRGGGSEPFLTYKYLRGDEQGTMDLILHPEMVHHCLDKLFDLAYEKTRRIYEQIPGVVMITYVAEDLGSQENLMYSPGQIREFFLPRMKRMMDLAHEAGAFVFHHSDGAVREMIPDMIDIGIDVLNPVQWRCRGMEREGLKRDFGDRLVFHGAMDNQHTLPFGSVDEVRREVVDNLRLLGPDGYILAPCHNLQSITPPENIVAMYDTAYAEGRR